MWYEARKQEKLIRGMMVDYKRRAERRKGFYDKIVCSSHPTAVSVVELKSNMSVVLLNKEKGSRRVSSGLGPALQDPHRRQHGCGRR